MPPLPKDPSVRRRRNRVAGARVLTFPSAKTKVPALPTGRDWHSRTAAWWEAAWRSPMASEWLDSDAERLLMLAVLVDTFWTNGDVGLLAEIRLTGALFGLSPIDRRRLQWEVERGEDAEARTEQRRTSKRPSSAPKPKTDPRLALAQ